MNKHIDIDLLKHRQALDDWLADCKRRINLRFPNIDFDAFFWPIRTLYQTAQQDWYFTEPLADLAEKDSSYRDALRCFVAEMILDGKPKHISDPVNAYRQMAAISPHVLFHITMLDLRQLEERLLTHAKENPQAANRASSTLSVLSKLTTQLARKGVLPALGFYARASIKAELKKIRTTHQARKRDGKAELLDRRMESFNEAFNRMVDGAPELSARDRVALCAVALLLCAPSRINELLCMSIDDHVTVEDYAQRTIGELNAVHSAHQMLLVTMKGSKGAEWSPKPVLNFMIDVFHYCISIIQYHGKRSRMLVEWYQRHPNTLYLPPDLEHLRGRAISRRNLERIIQLNGNLPDEQVNQTAILYFKELADRQFKGPNPAFTQKKGKGPLGHRMIDYLTWADVEALLLNKVNAALDQCRRVTFLNPYQGDLAKMLFLFDDNKQPFLPGAANYQSLARTLKLTEKQRTNRYPPTIFQILHITMPVGGKVKIAEIESHDPRRWLTTMALIHGEKLSDVLINKWANRCKLSQLKHYDLRTAEIMAAQAAMPEVEALKELTDLSNGMATMETLEDQFGLQVAIVTADDAGIAMTSMDAVAEAIENRPIAKSSRGIIIIYPQRFGVCFHQHHEKPCRNYSNDLSVSCLTCNEAAVTKGHFPTNEEIRRTSALLFSSVVRHLENLVLTHNRNIADDFTALGEHMLTLIEKSLSKDTLDELAVHLIEEVNQIIHLLKDRHLARRLEQAFVARGFVKRLDDPTVRCGALMKYHNPTQHAEPLLERALEEHGGRGEVERDEQALVAKYPLFAPKALGLKDERHLIAPDDDESED